MHLHQASFRLEPRRVVLYSTVGASSSALFVESRLICEYRYLRGVVTPIISVFVLRSLLEFAICPLTPACFG